MASAPSWCSGGCHHGMVGLRTSDREDDVGFLIQDLYKVILQLPRLIPPMARPVWSSRLMKSVVSPAMRRAAGLPAACGSISQNDAGIRSRSRSGD